MIPVEVTYATQLFADTPNSGITARDVTRLRNTPLAGDHVSLTMLGPSEEAREVRTINEMQAAQRDGFFAPTTAAMIGQSWFTLASDLLDAVMIGRESTVSFLEPISRIDLLPARYLSLFMNVDDPAYRETIPSYKHLTIAEMANKRLADIVETGPSSLTVQAGVTCYLTELARGDLDGDGIQDMLVWQFCRVVGGTMAWGSSLALSRISVVSKFTTVRLPFR
jgi:hypothetical protein